MRISRANNRGFTLVELLTSLTVTSIILGAIGTIAYATSSANTQLEAMSRRQAHIRYSSLRLGELVRNSVAVWRLPYNVAVWVSDANGDGAINADEVVYIETSSEADRICLVDFPGVSAVVSQGDVETGQLKTDLKSQNKHRSTTLLENVSGVWFDVVNGNFVNIEFDVVAESGTNTYRVCESLKGSGEHMLSTKGLVN